MSRKSKFCFVMEAFGKDLVLTLLMNPLFADVLFGLPVFGTPSTIPLPGMAADCGEYQLGTRAERKGKSAMNCAKGALY